jgi:hypothetical protein
MMPHLTTGQAKMILDDMADRERLLDCYHFAQEHLPEELRLQHMALRYPNLRPTTKRGA